jgi:hypothetical protein
MLPRRPDEITKSRLRKYPALTRGQCQNRLAFPHPLSFRIALVSGLAGRGKANPADAKTTLKGIEFSSSALLVHFFAILP